MAETGSQLLHSSTAAAPPSATKIGAPNAAAIRMSASSGHSMPYPVRSHPVSPSWSSRGIARPRTAVQRPHRVGTRRQSRQAMSRKPTGMTATAAQTGTPSANSRPPSHSARVSTTLA